MPTPAPTLYGLAAENVPYTKAALVACTGPLSGVASSLTLADLAEPTTAGYQRVEAATLADLCDDLEIVPGRMVRLVSRVIHWHNASAFNQPLSGVALVVWSDPSTPHVLAAIPAPCVWAIGHRAGGRLYVTGLIHDEGSI